VGAGGAQDEEAGALTVIICVSMEIAVVVNVIVSGGAVTVLADAVIVRAGAVAVNMVMVTGRVAATVRVLVEVRRRADGSLHAAHGGVGCHGPIAPAHARGSLDQTDEIRRAGVEVFRADALASGTEAAAKRRKPTLCFGRLE